MGAFFMIYIYIIYDIKVLIMFFNSFLNMYVVKLIQAYSSLTVPPFLFSRLCLPYYSHSHLCQGQV